MQISKISSAQNFGYKLTPAFIEQFSYIPQTIKDLQNEGNDRVTIDYSVYRSNHHDDSDDRNKDYSYPVVKMTMEVADKDYRSVSGIRDISLNSFRIHENKLMETYFNSCEKNETFSDKIEAFIDKFPHLKKEVLDYISGVNSDDN